MYKSDLAISHQFAATFLMIFALGVSLAGWGGYKLALRKHRLTEYAVHHENTNLHQSDSILEKQYANQLEDLTKHIGRIEANLIRVNALGAHLVEYAQLSPEEFNFDNQAPMGGPLIAADFQSLSQILKDLERIAEVRVKQLNTINQILQFQKQHRELKFDNKGSPVRNGWISSYFGNRTDPITGQKAWHGGVDIVAEEGTPILALAGGIVTKSAECGAYGNLVEIYHGNGLSTRYGHNQKRFVKTGQLVKKGETIASVGSTGRSTGPHVHLEVHRNGQAIDPGKFFPDLKRHS